MEAVLLRILTVLENFTGSLCRLILPTVQIATSLNNVFVKNNLGEMVPVNTLVTLQRVYGPETVTRNNLFNAVTINGMPKPGYSSGDAIKAIQEVAAKVSAERVFL